MLTVLAELKVGSETRKKRITVTDSEHALTALQLECANKFNLSDVTFRIQLFDRAFNDWLEPDDADIQNGDRIRVVLSDTSTTGGLLCISQMDTVTVR